jgi:hypothetical protein
MVVNVPRSEGVEKRRECQLAKTATIQRTPMVRYGGSRNRLVDADLTVDS